MFGLDYQAIITSIYSSILNGAEFYAPKILGALVLLLIGLGISILCYKIVVYLFHKFKLIDLIDKLTIDFEDIATNNDNGDQKTKSKEGGAKTKKFSQRVKVDQIAGKAIAYYIFLVFFRLSIIVIGIDEVEKFLGELLTYLPSLFIAVVIGFFGVRFANFIYDVVYQTLNLTKQKTAKIIASGAKIIILFFTLMAVLDKIGIASDIIHVILTGFVAMLTLAGGIAFGLGGKDVAKEILESLKK